MHFTLAGLALFAITLSQTAAPIPKASVKDEDKIVGVWQIVSADFGAGVPVPKDNFKQRRLEFKAGGKLVIRTGDKPAEEFEYKLDPAPKVKAIDVIEDGDVSPGIYELDGDTLKLGVVEDGNAVRPTEMKPGAKGVSVMTLKRVKAEKKDK